MGIPRNEAEQNTGRTNKQDCGTRERRAGSRAEKRAENCHEVGGAISGAVPSVAGDGDRGGLGGRSSQAEGEQKKADDERRAPAARDSAATAVRKESCQPGSPAVARVDRHADEASGQERE